MTTADTVMRKKISPSSLSFLLVLTLLMSSMTVSSFAAVTATVLRSKFAAGTSGNTIQISWAGLTPGVGVTIAPPSGTGDEALTGISTDTVPAPTNGTATVGTGGIVTATMVVTYTGITVPKKISTYTFDVAGVTSNIPFIRTQLDGSGQISITSGATVVAGKANQTVKFRYTATATDGRRNSPEDRWKVLNNSVLELWFPKSLLTPSSANLKAVTGTGAPTVGTVTTIGANPNYWIASIPFTAFTTIQTLDLSYGPITVASDIGVQTFYDICN